MAKRSVARPLRLLWPTEQHADDGQLRLPSAAPLAPGSRPAQSTRHDVGAIQPNAAGLPASDADNPSHRAAIAARRETDLGRSRMRESRKSGSVRGAESDLRPYSTTDSDLISAIPI